MMLVLFLVIFVTIKLNQLTRLTRAASSVDGQTVPRVGKSAQAEVHRSLVAVSLTTGRRFEFEIQTKHGRLELLAAEE